MGRLLPGSSLCPPPPPFTPGDCAFAAKALAAQRAGAAGALIYDDQLEGYFVLYANSSLGGWDWAGGVLCVCVLFAYLETSWGGTLW